MDRTSQVPLQQPVDPSSMNHNARHQCSPTSMSLGFVCPVCGGQLMDIKLKRICSRCRAIVETCCEGGRG